MPRFIWKMIFGIGLVVAITAVLICACHPILFKWLCGDANRLGEPVSATIYTDNHLNNTIKIYHSTKNGYLLALTETDHDGMLKYINLSLDEKWVGRPVATGHKDYDLINGTLFQSDAGAKFIDFRDAEKGFNLNPQLLFQENKTIKFDVPPGWLKFRNVCIILR